MKALNIRAVDIPGVPISLLAFAVEHLPAFITRPVLTKAVGGGRGSKMPSFYIDLHAGRKQSEVTFLNGAVSRKGAALGIPTPVNDAYTSTLTAMAEGTVPMETYDHSPEKLVVSQ